MINTFRKKIGDYHLQLKLDNKHEINYSKNKNHIDAMLASLFIKNNFKVLDLGANIGFCSLNYIKYGASKVDEYEPQKEIFERLNSIENYEMKAFNIAVSDENTKKTLYVSKTHNQGHTLDMEQVKLFQNIFSDQLSKEIVQTKRLDDIYTSSETFDFIKIDIEGHELQALRGARNLLKRSKSVTLQIEIYEKYLPDTLKELKQTFNHIYLVCFSEEKNKLYLTKNFNDEPLEGFRKNPPNYICSNWSLGRFTI